MNKSMDKKSTVIIGAGPSGLSAAYTLAKNGQRPLVIEKGNKVGGMAKTHTFNGCKFDIGGHRFFTNIDEIQLLWENILGENFLKVPRLSRIFYQKHFFKYPLAINDVLLNLGAFESLTILASYLHARLFPAHSEQTFDLWISNRFGKRLFSTFFKSYTEKVWGIPCNEIQSAWAKQRIKGLSLAAVVIDALLGHKKLTSLINEFHYPVHGSGMMWDSMASAIKDTGGTINLCSEITSLFHEDGLIQTIAVKNDQQTNISIPVDHLISSMPINQLLSSLSPSPPAEILHAASKVQFRSFIQAGLIVNKKNIFPDQWLYIHDPDLKVGRIQNYKNWSLAMVSNPEQSAIGMEYFCTSGDDICSQTDDQITTLAAKEFCKLGFADQKDITASFVIREWHAYPVYDQNYDKNLKIIRNYLHGFNNLQTIGRNGMHQYKNMDHAMQTGLLSAKNILGEQHDIWTTQDTSPDTFSKKVASDESTQKIIKSFARMDRFSFSMAVGVVTAIFFFTLTLWTNTIGGEIITYIELLNQFFIGYKVSIPGAFIAGGYGLLWGFIGGGLFAFLRNLLLGYYIFRAKNKFELMSVRNFFDQL